MAMSTLPLVSLTFAGLVTVVGGYVFMFLHVMRSDPREQEYRKDNGDNNGLIPSKKSKKELAS